MEAGTLLYLDDKCTQKAELPDNDYIYHMQSGQPYYSGDTCDSKITRSEQPLGMSGLTRRGYKLEVEGPAFTFAPTEEKGTRTLTYHNVRNTGQYIGCHVMNGKLLAQNNDATMVDCQGEGQGTGCATQ